jgi:hypothetical protein
MTFLQLIGLIFALGAVAALLCLPYADAIAEPEADGGALDFDGMSAWPRKDWRMQVDGECGFFLSAPPGTLFPTAQPPVEAGACENPGAAGRSAAAPGVAGVRA